MTATIKQMKFGACTHCGKKPATRMPLKHCTECADELFNLSVDSDVRKEWINKGVVG